MRRVTYLVIAIGLSVQGAAAHADPDSWFPAGMTTDRIGTETWAVNLELAYNAFDDDVIDEGTLLRFDLYGQYLAQVGANRLGGYAWVPVVRSVGTGGDEETALGSPEVGGAFAMAASPVTDLVLRGGLVLSTVDEEDFFPVLFGSYGRLTDAYTSVPDITWLRLGGSVLHDAAPYFLRADLGFDMPFSDDDDLDALLRFNAAAGVDLDAAVLLAELATLGIIGNEPDNLFLHTLSLTLRARGQTFSPGVGLVVPIDEDLQGFLDFAIVAGVRIADSN
jgi:hypothetical protein